MCGGGRNPLSEVTNAVSGVFNNLGRSVGDFTNSVTMSPTIRSLATMGMYDFVATAKNELVDKPAGAMNALAQQQVDAQNAAVATQKEQTRLNDLNYTRDQQRIRARAQTRARRGSSMLSSNIGISAVPGSGTKTLIGS